MALSLRQYLELFGDNLPEPAVVVPCTFQGHGPSCRWFRHHVVGGLAVSSIGDSEDDESLGHPYESQIFLIDEGGYRPLGPRVYPRSQNRAFQAHQELIERAREMDEERRRR